RDRCQKRVARAISTEVASRRAGVEAMRRARRALDGLDDDIRDHIARETQDNIDRGMAPEEARRQALMKFGNLALAKEDTHAVWVWQWLEQLVQDLRHGTRVLIRRPGF